ncbi:MAG TPA: hypothetical protein VHD84_02550 [Candidatus Saccharimonadales bacterium]|nr:hypothetical protein [Candidatus Saccharimonadales bacterium]
MAIAFRAASSQDYSGTATSTTTSYPAGIQTNDLLVLTLVTYGGPVNTPSGWTSLFQQKNTSSTQTLVTFIRLYDGTSSAPTVSWTSSQVYSWGMAAWSGVDTDTPIDISTSPAATGHSTTPTATSITTNYTDDLIWVASSDSNPITLPSGYTSRVSTAAGGTLVMGDKMQSAAGATGSVAGSLTNDFWVAGQLALKPAGAVATPTVEAVGHSYCQGDGVTSTQRATYLLASDLGYDEDNHAIDGAVLTADDNTSLPGGFNTIANDLVRNNGSPYASPIANGVGVVWYGINDVGEMSNDWDSRDQAIYSSTLRFAISRMIAAKIFDDGDSSVVYSGFSSNADADGSGTGTSNHDATTSGSTVTITVPSDFPGGTVALYLASYFGEGASWTFTVDGSSMGGTLDTTAHGQIASADSALMFCQRFTSLAAGTHTIVATAGSITGHAYFDSWAIEAPTAPDTLVIGQFKLTSTSTTGYGFYTAEDAPHTPTDDDIDDLNSTASSIVDEFPAPVKFVDLSSLDNTTHIQSDGLHPDATGHSIIAGLMEDTLNQSSAPTETVGVIQIA